MAGWEQLFGSADTQTFSQCSSYVRSVVNISRSEQNNERTTIYLEKYVLCMYVYILDEKQCNETDFSRAFLKLFISMKK